MALTRGQGLYRLEGMPEASKGRETTHVGGRGGRVLMAFSDAIAPGASSY